MTKKRFNISAYLKKRNAKRFSLFVIIAFVFLVLSKLSLDYKENITLKINLDAIDDDIVLKNDSLNHINVYVQAKGFTLLTLPFSKVKTLNLDVKQYVAKNNKHFIFDTQKHRFLVEDKLGKAYKVISIKPDSLRLAYSKLASKLVPVRLEENISFSDGFDMLKPIALSTDSVKIIGPYSEIDKINTVRTETLNLDEVKDNINTSLKLDFNSNNTIQVIPETLQATGIVERFTEGTIEVPVDIQNKPKDVIINHFPKKISVTYYIALKDYKSISVSDFTIQCDFSSIKSNQNYLVPKLIKKPKSIKRVNLKQNRVDFIKL